MKNQNLQRSNTLKKNKTETKLSQFLTQNKPKTMKIKNSVIDTIGNTPMIKINRLDKLEGIQCDIFVKCEFYNPGGSIKARVGQKLLQTAEKNNQINTINNSSQDFSTIIEPTSGNTGIGLCLASTLLKCKTIMVMPEKISQEKRSIMQALGGTIVRTPNEASYEDENSHYKLAPKISQKISNSFMPNQFENKYNPEIHYETTAPEIYDQMDQNIDYIFIGVGSGGSITGISKFMKERNKNIKIIGVDPASSIISKKLDFIIPQQIEGIGGDFIPKVLQYENIDDWVQTDDKNSFQTARNMIKEEGLLVGGSSGAILYGAFEYIKNHNLVNKRIVVLAPDGFQNYLNKFIDDA